MNISRFTRRPSLNRLPPRSRTLSLNRSPPGSSPKLTPNASPRSPRISLITNHMANQSRKSNNGSNFKSLGPLLILGALPTDFGKISYNDGSERKKINHSIRASNNIYYLNRDEANSRNNYPYAVKISNAERKRYFQINLTQRGNFTKLHEYHDFLYVI